MSGVCGIVSWSGEPMLGDALTAMIDAAPHRAVDRVGRWSSPYAQLAHLAHVVTAEDALERQPLVDHELVLVADARIDNRDELIPLLGGHLASDRPTDADVIMAAYRRWGRRCPARLIGDFSFVVWDSSTRSVFAARDPMAMRALYIHVTRARILFASEVKQILAVPGVPAKLDEQMLAQFLTSDAHSPTASFYAGIEHLQAGHALQADADRHDTQRFWDVDPDERIRYASTSAYTEHFLELFTEAVRARARTTKPIGILLSGGMDSGSVASTLGWLGRQGLVTLPGVHTYSWAFDTLPQCDERSISDANARAFGFDVSYVSADESAPLARYPEHGPDRDEPMTGAYQPLIETALAQARDDGVGSMLSGYRGDLMTAGWVLDYMWLVRGRRWRALVAELREHASVARVPVPGVALRYVAWPLARAAGSAVRRGLSAWGRGDGGAGATGGSGAPPWLRAEWLSGVGARRDGDDVFSEAVERMGFARAMRHRLAFVPVHMRGMVWLERTAARFGQGVSDPWSDRRLVRFAIGVPQQVLNLPGSVDKRFVRDAMRGIMPEPVRLATRKIVPTPLYERALRQTAVTTIRSLMTDSQVEARGYVDGAAWRSHYDGVLAGAPAHPGLWWTLNVEMWLRRYWL